MGPEVTTVLGPTHADVHTLLLGLAGRAPDAWLAVTRSSLAHGDHEHVAQTIAALARTGITFTAEEAATVTALAGSRAPAPAVEAEPTPEHRFATGPHRSPANLPSTVAALWCAIRADGTVVHLAEAADGADPAAVTGELQRIVGDPVEVFGPRAELPRYHEAALAAAALIAIVPAPVHVAKVFDGADRERGPYFVTDRERVDEQRREELLTYLRAGENVLDVDGELDDVLEPGVTVPAGFRSDGDWVWSEATVHYLDRHGVAPDPDLAAHIDERGGWDALPSPLCRSERARVRAVLTGGPRDVEAGTAWRAG